MPGGREHSRQSERGVGVRNTRMHVDDLRELRSRANIYDILAWYDGLERNQVKAVIEFAARSLDTPVASR